MKNPLKSLAHKLSRIQKRRASLRRHSAALNTFVNYCDRSQPGFEGSVQVNEFEFLKTLVAQANDIDGPLVEVGTLFGFSTQMIAGWKKTEKELITIDNYSWNPIGLLPAAHRDFTRRGLHYLTERCATKLFEGLSTDFYASYKGPRPALIFIDAAHTYEAVLEDIRWAKSVGVPIIAGHDYSRFWPGVKRAVDESFGTDFKVEGTLWASVVPDRAAKA